MNVVTILVFPVFIADRHNQGKIMYSPLDGIEFFLSFRKFALEDKNRVLISLISAFLISFSICASKI